MGVWEVRIRRDLGCGRWWMGEEEMIIGKNIVPLRMRGVKRLFRVCKEYFKSGGKDDSKGKDKS